MPLLNGQNFVKSKPPTNLNLDDEVFFCPVTLEIFTNYNEMFERTILVNSPSWACSICLKSNYTYTEAQDCELTDMRQLSSFGQGLTRAMLHIIRSIKQVPLHNLVEFLHQYTNDRYFVAEYVAYFVGEQNKLHPHGPYKWENIFVDPEPDWQSLANGVTLAKHLKFVPKKSSSSSDKTKGFNHKLVSSINRDAHSTSNNDESSKNVAESSNNKALSSEAQAWQVQRRARLEQYELARDWGLCIIKEDLELSDLVPLPEYAPLNMNIAPIDFGHMLQVVEFFHCFAKFLQISVPRYTLNEYQSYRYTNGLPRNTKINQPVRSHPDKRRVCEVEVGNTLTLEVLEDAVTKSDPSGPLADIIIGLMLTIRKLENEINSRQPTSTMLNASQAASNAVGSVSIGGTLVTSSSNNSVVGNVSSHGTSSFSSQGTSAADYAATYQEIAQSDGGVLARLLRQAAIAALECELLGLPTQVASGKAGKAAVTLAMQQHEKSLRSEEGVETSNTLMNQVVRSASVAAAAGAISVPPLDRCGLTEALWLHFVSAAARGGGFRGQIWGGTRPLDDPALMLVRNEPGLIRKLKTKSVYSLSVNEKLTLIQTLIDEIMIQPKMREHVEDNHERQRMLRAQLKTLFSQNIHVKIEDNQGQLATNSSQTFSGNPKAKGNSNKGKKQSKGIKNVNPIGISIGAESLSNFELCDSAKPIDPTLQLSAKEHLYCESIAELSRGSGMMPLGQDRFHRRYWLVLSVPCIVIEDVTPSSDDAAFDAAPRHLSVVNEQVDPNYSLGSNLLEARNRLDELVRSSVVSHELDLNVNAFREQVIHQIACSFPIRFSEEESGPPIENIRKLVNPERPSDPSHHATHPVVIQSRMFTPTSNRSRWSLLLPPGHMLSKRDLPQSDMDQDHLVMLDLLEAALNPRGVRESKLRKNIGQFRQILLTVMKSTPYDYFFRKKQNHSPKASTNVENGPVAEKNSDLSATNIVDQDSAANTGLCSINHVWPETEDVLLDWLERQVDHMIKRFRTSDSNGLIRENWLDQIMRGDGTDPLNNKLIELDQFIAKHEESEILDIATKRKIRLKKVARTLVETILNLHPLAITGPLSVEEKTLRGGLGAFMSLGDGEILNLSPELHDREDTWIMEQLPQRCMHLTNGVQRWICLVLRSKSVSELHLLAMALERCIRKAAYGGKYVPNCVTNWAESFPLEELVCAACNRSADPNPYYGRPSAALSHAATPIHNPLYPFAQCGGCGCPHHLNCLLDPTARLQGRGKRRALPPNSVKLLFAPNVTGHFCLTSSLGHNVSSRIETSGSALILCGKCRISSGWPKSADQIDEVTENNNTAIDDNEECIFETDPAIIGEQEFSLSESLNKVEEVQDTNLVIIPRKRNDRKSVKIDCQDDENKSPDIEMMSITYPDEIDDDNEIKPAEKKPEMTILKPARKKCVLMTSAPEEILPSPDLVIERGQLDSHDDAISFMKQVIAQPFAKPLKKCGISRSFKSSAENNEYMSNGGRRVGKRGSINRHRLYANDLSELLDLVQRNELPGPPKSILTQMQLLIARWTSENRPSSRMCLSAKELSEFIERRFPDETALCDGGEMQSSSDPLDDYENVEPAKRRRT